MASIVFPLVSNGSVRGKDGVVLNFSISIIGNRSSASKKGNNTKKPKSTAVFPSDGVTSSKIEPPIHKDPRESIGDC
jgi:hypothetical protein